MKIEDVQVGTWISNEDSTEFLLPQKIDISLGTVHGLLICAWRGEFYHAFRLYTQVHDKEQFWHLELSSYKNCRQSLVIESVFEDTK